MVNNSKVPETYDYSDGSWYDNNGANWSGTNMRLLPGKPLAIYIPASDLYCTFEFTVWGAGGDGGEIGWTRMCFP